jgi:hypothetical protein
MQKPSKTIYRNQNGTMEALAAELVVGTLVTIAFMVFLIDCGKAGAYKQKLGFVSIQSARFASANSSANPAQETTAQFAKNLCAQNGIHVQGLQVKVRKTSLNNNPAVACDLSGLFELPTFGTTFLPSSIAISDSSVALAQNSGSSGSGLEIIGNDNTVNDDNGVLPSGKIIGNGNSSVNQLSLGNTIGNGNSNAGGNTIGNGNSNTSGNTIGNGNSQTSGGTIGNGNSDTSGTTIGNGLSHTSGNTVGNGF